MPNFEKGNPNNFKIKANKIFKARKATLYNCEGDEYWFPHDYSYYHSQDNILEIPDWLYNKNFGGK